MLGINCFELVSTTLVAFWGGTEDWEVAGYKSILHPFVGPNYFELPGTVQNAAVEKKITHTHIGTHRGIHQQ